MTEYLPSTQAGIFAYEIGGSVAVEGGKKPEVAIIVGFRSASAGSLFERPCYAGFRQHRIFTKLSKALPTPVGILAFKKIVARGGMN